MPTIQPGVKVLVTGANGYLAMWVAQRLLERGYSVRGTVRSASKGVYMKEYFQSYGDRFEIAIVSDFTEEGAFDKSLEGVTGVVHVATPLPNEQMQDPEDYIRPAVNGTLSIMKSAINSPSVKRIVYTSTTGTIAKKTSEPTLLSEKDWNDESVRDVQEQGAKAPNLTKYIASKVLAEKAAWDFYEKQKETLQYDFVVINAPWILGPPIHDLGNDPSLLGTSFGIWYNNVVGNPDNPRSDETLTSTTIWIDVRDLADAHVTALEKEEALGERILVAEGHVSWQHWIDIANEVQSSTSRTHPLPLGKPGIPPNYVYVYDISKAPRLLGMKYRDIHETTKDSLEVLAKKGW